MMSTSTFAKVPVRRLGPVAGLTLALLLLALVPAAANAAFFQASGYPASVGAETPEVTFTTEAGSVDCQLALDGGLANHSESLGLSMAFDSCSAFGFLEATVDSEGCELLLEASGESELSGTADVVCPGTDSIKITSFTCSAEIVPQTGLASTAYSNGSGSVEVAFELESVDYTVTSDGFLCPFAGTGPRSGGVLLADAVLSATFEEAPATLLLGPIGGAVEVLPSTVTIKPGAESAVGGFYFIRPGEYEVLEQVLIPETEFELTKKSTASCPGKVVVKPEEQKACLFTIKAIGGAEATATLWTKWKPAGAKEITTTMTHVQRP